MSATYVNKQRSVRVVVAPFFLQDVDSKDSKVGVSILEASLYTPSAFGGDRLQAVGYGPDERIAVANAYQLWTAKKLEGPQDV